VAWASGPYLWPWGAAALAVVAVGVAACFARWWQARETVAWGEAVEFRRGSRVLALHPDALTAVDVRPAAVWTRLHAGPHRWTLSHRLVGAEELLGRLRLRRPDLFAEPGEALRLRVSSVAAVFQVVLAAGAAGAGWVLLPWLAWLGLGFEAAAAFALLRVVWYIPRLYVVGQGRLTVVYWLRRRVWGRPDTVREDAYAAGGAVFFKLHLGYSSRAVVLDEGQLNDPLRPHAGWITRKLMEPLDR